MPQDSAMRRAADDGPASGAASPKRTRPDQEGSSIMVQTRKVDICWELDFSSHFPNPTQVGDFGRWTWESTAEENFSVSGLTDDGLEKDISCKMRVRVVKSRGLIVSYYPETVLSLELKGTFFSDNGKYNGNIGVTVHIVDKDGKMIFNAGAAHPPASDGGITTKDNGNGDGEYDEVKFRCCLPEFMKVWCDKDKYFPDGVLRLKYQLILFHDKPTQNLLCLPKAMATLSHDLGKLFRDGGDTADFVIKCGDTEFTVHHLILRARSPVFASMLAAPMREMAERKVDVEDVEPEIMKALLEYIYSSVIHPDRHDSDQLISLTFAAEKYELVELRDTCIQCMVNHMRNMNPTALGQLAGLVHLLADARIRDQVLKYCADNFSTLSQTEGFVAEVRKIPTNLLQQLEFLTAYNV